VIPRNDRNCLDPGELQEVHVSIEWDIRLTKTERLALPEPPGPASLSTEAEPSVTTTATCSKLTGILSTIKPSCTIKSGRAKGKKSNWGGIGRVLARNGRCVWCGTECPCERVRQTKAGGGG
jgi:hypothetical protein